MGGARVSQRSQVRRGSRVVLPRVHLIFQLPVHAVACGFSRFQSDMPLGGMIPYPKGFPHGKKKKVGCIYIYTYYYQFNIKNYIRSLPIKLLFVCELTELGVCKCAPIQPPPGAHELVLIIYHEKVILRNT